MNGAEQLRTVTKKVSEVAEKVKDNQWQRVYVANGSQIQKSPDEGDSIELANWPSRGELRKAIDDWNASLEQVDKAWERLRDDERIGLIDWKRFQQEKLNKA